MIDLIRLTVPFKLSAVSCSGSPMSTVSALADGEIGQIKDMLRYTSSGLLLQAKSVSRSDDGSLNISDLSHPFDRLPSSFSSMAFKILEINGWPHVTLKASPAKLMQGHNVYGGSSIRQSLLEMLGSLAVAFPDVYEDLEIGLTHLTNLDVTYSARFANPDDPNSELLGRELISYLRTLSSGQLMARGVCYDTTTYWGSADSQLGYVKAYLKHDEFLKQLKDVKREAATGDALAKRMLAVMSDEKLQNWSKNLLRLEASFKKDWLRRAGLPLNAWHLVKYQEELLAQGRCFLREIWAKKCAPLFSACEGQTMKVLDDEDIKQAIRSSHFRQTKSGAISYSYADDLFRFYLDIKNRGYEVVKKQASDTQASKLKFYRYVKDLGIAGIAKATLQAFSLNNTPSVVPVLRFLQVDFNSQHPADYVEPVSRFYVGHPVLSLVA